MKISKTYYINNPEGYPDAVITTENQHKYVAFYGGIFALDMSATDFTNNPFLGGGLVGKTPSDLESCLEPNVCSVNSLVKALYDYNPEEFNSAVANLAATNTGFLKK